jgi:predicted MFS family arabinose efflux permease
VPHKAQGKLFKWVAILTGSKNALKGIGFFLGAVLLSIWGFSGAILSMFVLLVATLVCSLFLLSENLGQSKQKAKFSQLLSKSPAINALSFSRLFLFASRDVWFVVALPVFLSQYWSWSPAMVGGFFATWVIAYGLVQTLTPVITRRNLPNGKLSAQWVFALAVIPAMLTLLVSDASSNNATFNLAFIIGLFIFGAIFAVNSSIHSYLIVRLAAHDGTSLDVGFYYMANAAGRLLGTVLSGAVFQWYGLEACLWVSSAFLLIAAFAVGIVKTP